MASDLPNKKSCSTIGILALTYNCILKDVRVKPQNRTEASPTTTECSTTELELPVMTNVAYLRMRRAGLEPTVNIVRPVYSRLPYQLDVPTLTCIFNCSGLDLNQFPRICRHVLYQLSYLSYNNWRNRDSNPNARDANTEY